MKTPLRRFTALFVPLFVSVVAWGEAPAVVGVTFHPASDAVRFFHARVVVAPGAVAYDVRHAEVNGREEMYIAQVDGKLTQWEPNGRVNRPGNGDIPANKEAVFLVRCPWTNGQAVTIHLRGTVHDSDAEIDIAAEATAPDTGGFPFPGWIEHRLLMLREDFGIERAGEPFMFFLSDEASRVGSWKKELRVAKYDVATGASEEIPSQVIYEKRQFDTPALEKAYATCQAAVIAEVPANGKAYYLIAYGNPGTEAPQYTTDLTMTQDGGTISIGNEFYNAKIHPPSGQLHGFESKTFGAGDNTRFGYMPDSGYTLHYNPDVWVKNGSWTHTHGWNPPPHVQIEAGPVAVITRRWGHLPLASEVEVEVVYHFFSRTPYMLAESTMDITQDVVVNALRNEEVVFSPSATEVDHAGWMRANGEIGYQPIVQKEGMTPGMVEILEPDAPFVCLTRDADRIGMASLRLNQHAGSRAGWPPVVASSITVVADYGWDFRYWSRALVYPWGDYVPDQPTIINAGTYYGEKSAFCLFPIGDGDTPEAKLAYLDALSDRLHKPIQIDHQGAGPW